MTNPGRVYRQVLSWECSCVRVRKKEGLPDGARTAADPRDQRWRRARSLAWCALAARRSRANELAAMADAHAELSVTCEKSPSGAAKVSPTHFDSRLLGLKRELAHSVPNHSGLPHSFARILFSVSSTSASSSLPETPGLTSGSRSGMASFAAGPMWPRARIAS